jgi:hypothetical protein
LEFEVPHGNSFGEIKFSSNLSEHSSNESWGVRNIRVYLATDTRWELFDAPFYDTTIPSSALSGWNFSGFTG